MSWFKKLFGSSSERTGRRAAAPVAEQGTPVAPAPAQASAPVAEPAPLGGLPKIAIVTGSTRPGRNNLGVAQWVLEQARQRTDAEFELVDIDSFDLPVLDEAYPAAYQNYTNDHTKAWAAKIAEFDGYVFVTPEYNHSVAPALANALSYLNAEFANKAAGIVGYGSAFGARAVEHLRGILSELQVAHVQKQGMFSLFTDFENFSVFKPTELQAASLAPVLDQLIPWTKALETVRAEASVNA